jgi:HEPN domain-containing protein
MSSHDEIAEIIYQWVAKAENDWKNASYMLRLKTDCPTDTVCFHAQQCVEKYIKALLVLKGTDFPKTHDIARLMALLPAVWRPRITDAEQEKLTDYAAVSRYPGDYEPITPSEAQNAVKIARRIRKEIRVVLPEPSLKKRK